MQALTLLATLVMLSGTRVAASEVAAKVLPPRAVVTPPAIDTPRDIAFPGTLHLEVDATDVLRGIHRIHETVPVHGPQHLTLLFPQWIPGDHVGPNSLDQLAGLVVSAGGKTLKWRRDTLEARAFHINVPAGTQLVELDYQYLVSTQRRMGPVLATPTLLDLQWQSHVLYPAGYYARRIRVDPALTLPTGWQFASALDGAKRVGDVVHFAPVTLDTLVDSPVMAARWMKQYSLSDDPVPVRLDIAADSESGVDVSTESLNKYRRAVAQAYKLFGARHYDHYDQMIWLSNGFGPAYFEQRRSGESAMPTAFFSDPERYRRATGVPYHGFVHSWNGLFRTPAGMWTPNFNTPQQTGLLWVFEGLTDYWNTVLDARSGIASHEDSVAYLETTASDASLRSGLQWRTLEDVSNELVMQDGNSNIYPEGRTQVWPDWQLETFDAYSQGELIWLDIDTLIRQRSGGQRSLDDFARGFFGINDGSMVPVTYTLDDLVAALNAVLPYDWATFLHARVDSIKGSVDLDGIERGGYRLAWAEQPPPAQQANEDKRGLADLRFSLGITLDKEGAVSAVIWGSPAWQAGLVTGAKILAVNGQPFDLASIKAAITAARQGGKLDLRVARGATELLLPVVWAGGLRYPHLERIPGAPALLDDILKPRA